MKNKFKLIFFMSLMLILILGTTSQANISQEYVKYTFEHFKNFNCLSSYESNVKQILNNLNDSDYNFYTTYINNVLVENNINKLTDHNMTSVLDASVTRHWHKCFSIFYILKCQCTKWN